MIEFQALKLKGAIKTGSDTVNLHRPTWFSSLRFFLAAPAAAAPAAAPPAGRLGSWMQGLMDGARHVIGCRLTQETGVQNAFDDMARTQGYRPPRHRMTCDSIKEGSECV
jgi:hypothetical protein